jgi:hypothetical protein
MYYNQNGREEDIETHFYRVARETVEYYHCVQRERLLTEAEVDELMLAHRQLEN